MNLEIEKDSQIYRFLENGRFTSKFEVESKIGEGAYGDVFKVKYILDNNIYAIKKVMLHLG